jgi:hypothetical protein
MAIASPVRVTGPLRPVSVTPPRPVPGASGEGLRDEMTRERLAASVAHLPGLQVIGFDSDWWDGQAHVPCLVIRGGRRCRRLRVVETAGECVVVPFSRRTAQRWLAARRRPARIELGIPAQRRPGQADPATDVVLDAIHDVLRCRSRSCGALLPVGYAGGCPVCGDG